MKILSWRVMGVVLHLKKAEKEVRGVGEVSP